MRLGVVLWLCWASCAGAACVPRVQTATSVSLAWDATILSRTQTLSYYNVEKQVDGGTWASIGNPTGLTLTDADLAVGHSYYWRVSAVAIDGGLPITSGFGSEGTPAPCVQVIAGGLASPANAVALGGAAIPAFPTNLH
jgi:hypothetical protein